METNDLKDSLLFSAGAAQKLNESFANATASYLFLFCNYNPVFLCNSYGKNFANAIGNIYRLCNDTGRIIRNRKIFNHNYLASDDKTFLSEYFSVLDTLRAYDDHNNSPDNGNIQEELIQKAEKFYKNKTGKEYQDLDESDFQKLIEMIFQNTERFQKLIEQIINSIAKSQNKTEIIENCKSHIIEYYALQIYRNIILGQVKILMNEKNDYNAQKLFQYYLGKYQKSIKSFNKPYEYFEYYMKNYFDGDIKEFLKTYIIDDPDATMLPQGLIQEFIYRMIYPVQKGDKIELNLSGMTYHSDTYRFLGKGILINKLKLNVIVNIENNPEAERLEYLKKSRKEMCTVQANVHIKDIYENKKPDGIVMCTVSN